MHTLGKYKLSMLSTLILLALIHFQSLHMNTAYLCQFSSLDHIIITYYIVNMIDTAPKYFR